MGDLIFFYQSENHKLGQTLHTRPLKQHHNFKQIHEYVKVASQQPGITQFVIIILSTQAMPKALDLDSTPFEVICEFSERFGSCL